MSTVKPLIASSLYLYFTKPHPLLFPVWKLWSRLTSSALPYTSTMSLNPSFVNSLSNLAIKSVLLTRACSTRMCLESKILSVASSSAFFAFSTFYKGNRLTIKHMNEYPSLHCIEQKRMVFLASLVELWYLIQDHTFWRGALHLTLVARPILVHSNLQQKCIRVVLL